MAVNRINSNLASSIQNAQANLEQQQKTSNDSTVDATKTSMKEAAQKTEEIASKTTSGIGTTRDSFEKTSSPTGTDINALVQSAFRESYLEQTSDLKSFAGKVKHFNEVKKGIREHLTSLSNVSSESKKDLSDRLQSMKPGEPSGNIMEQLFHVFRESVSESNEDKKYWLNKLKEYNKIGEALEDYISSLTESARKLNDKVRTDTESIRISQATPKAVESNNNSAQSKSDDD